MNQYEEHEVTIEDLDYTINAEKFLLGKAQAVARLLENEDFKDLIMEGYLKTFALEQVSMLTHPACQSSDKQATIQSNIHATAALKEFLDNVLVRGEESTQAIIAHEQEKERMYEEAAANASTIANTAE